MLCLSDLFSDTSDTSGSLDHQEETEARTQWLSQGDVALFPDTG